MVARMELSHLLVMPDGAAPLRRAWFLHGFLGSGENWQGFARRLVTRRPDYGAVLVDLRLHGGSLGFAPPHTLPAVADDLERLTGALGDPEVVIGHSFGGRSALAFAARHRGALEQLWVLDAAPATREARADTSTGRVLAALGELPPSFADRKSFGDELARRGVDRGIALWLAKNLRREGGALRFALDVPALGELLAEHDRYDAWPLVEAPPPGLDLAFVLASRQSVVHQADRARLHELASRGVLRIEELADAGHWVHVDAPEALLGLLERDLPR